MRAKRCNFNVDKLKICYKQPSALYELAASRLLTVNKTITIFNNFIIRVLTQYEEDQPNTTKIVCSVYFTGSDTERLIRFGQLELHNSQRFNGLCWLELENSALYTVYTVNGWKFSCIDVLGYLAQELDLKFNNITKLEVACDSNTNVITRCLRLIKDVEKTDLIVNSHKVNDSSFASNDFRR